MMCAYAAPEWRLPQCSVGKIQVNSMSYRDRRLCHGSYPLAPRETATIQDLQPIRSLNLPRNGSAIAKASRNTWASWRIQRKSGASGSLNSTHSMELRRAGVPVKLREQPSRILAGLLENSGRMVTREELRQLLSIW